MNELETLRAVLRDLILGAQMMQDPVLTNPALKRYAAEVQRVAELALQGAADVAA